MKEIKILRYTCISNLNLPSGESIGYGDEIFVINEEVYIRNCDTDGNNMYLEVNTLSDFIVSNNQLFELNL